MAWIGSESRESDADGSLTNVSVLTDGEEIPVWVRGETRWISGVTGDTSCADVVAVLLMDEAQCHADVTISANPDEYVITERWRRVEQCLDCRTKILRIWNAWGEAQPEVRFSLRKKSDGEVGKDSGQESPTDSLCSVGKKRRHRIKQSVANVWPNSIHPKRLLSGDFMRETHKKGIEQLMKLILAQGETIQQQLRKLRDHETQICNIEEETHENRLKEHGSNYLLETYLNGLENECDDLESNKGCFPDVESFEKTHSDSGVITENGSDQTASPEMSNSPVNVESTLNHNLVKLGDELIGSNVICCTPKRKVRSKREKELIKEHINTKKYSQNLPISKQSEEENKSTTDDRMKIEFLEKLVIINKHLQREEELWIRLHAKCRRYEMESNSHLVETEGQLITALETIRQNMERSSNEMERNAMCLEQTNVILSTKNNVLKKLHLELERIENDPIEHTNIQVLYDGTLSLSNFVKGSNTNLHKSDIKSMFNGGLANKSDNLIEDTHSPLNTLV